MRSEFEEKEYESLLYHELEQNCDRVWSPGQCLENYIGFDRAAYIKDLDVWKKLGYSYCGGKSLVEHDLEILWNSLGVKREMPDFKFNMFIQAKRPYKVGYFPATLKYLGKPEGWHKFLVDVHQQLILERLSEAFDRMALVVYAAPRFSTIKDLYGYMGENNIVDNSVFYEAWRMHDHKTLYYSKEKCIACSRPEERENISIMWLINNFLEENSIYNDGIILSYSREDQYYNEKNKYNILQIVCNNIMKAVTNDYRLFKSSLCQKFLYEVNAIKGNSKYYEMRQDENEVLANYLIINRFCEIFGIQWYVLG